MSRRSRLLRRGRVQVEPTKEEVWSWFTKLSLEERSRMLSIEDKEGVDLVQKMNARKMEDGEGLFFAVDDGFDDLTERKAGTSKKKKMNHIFTNKNDFCFMRMSCLGHCNYPERLMAADRELEAAVRLCDTLEYLDTMSLSSSVLGNDKKLLFLLENASRGSFLAKPCRVEWVPGSQWVWQSPSWFEAMGFYTLGTFIAQKIEQAFWMRYWEHNAMDPRKLSECRKYAFPTSNSQALLSKTYLTEFWMGVAPLDRLQIVGSLGNVVDTALREHLNEATKETKGTAPNSEVGRVEVTRRGSDAARASAFHLKDVRLLSALLDFTMERRAIEYLFFKDKAEIDQHLFIEVLYFSPLRTAGTAINLVLRRLGFIVQKAYAEKLAMDLILGEASENNSKPKRKRKKKKRPNREKILRGKLGQAPEVVRRIDSGVKKPLVSLGSQGRLAHIMAGAQSNRAPDPLPTAAQCEERKEEEGSAAWEQVTSKAKKRKKRKKRRTCSLSAAPVVVEPPVEKAADTPEGGPCYASDGEQYRSRSQSTPSPAVDELGKTVPAQAAAAKEDWSQRDYTRKKVADRSTSCSPTRAMAGGVYKRARSTSMEDKAARSVTPRARMPVPTLRGAKEMPTKRRRDVRVRSGSCSPRTGPPPLGVKRSLTPTGQRSRAYQAPGTVRARGTVSSSDIRAYTPSSSSGGSPRRLVAARQRYALSDTLFSARVTRSQQQAQPNQMCYPGGSYNLASLLLDSPLSSINRAAPPDQPMRPARVAKPHVEGMATNQPAGSPAQRVDLFMDGLSPVIHELSPVDAAEAVSLTESTEAYVAGVKNFVSGLHQRLADRMIQRVKCSVGRLWPQSTIKVYGSYATGLSIPKSDLDLVVTIPGSVGGSPVHLLAAELSRQSWIKVLQPLFQAKVPVIKLESYGEAIPTDITFNLEDLANDTNMYRESVGYIHSARSQLQGMHRGVKACQMVVSLQRKLPSLKPLVLVLKQYLYDRGLNSTYTGGLASYSLVLMAASYLMLYHQQQVASLGVLLLGFLELFGVKFDYRTTGIAVSEALVVHFQRLPNLDRVYGPANLLIMDPLCPSNNIGSSTFAMCRVKAAFASAYTTLLAAMPMQHAGPASLLEVILPSLNCSKPAAVCAAAADRFQAKRSDSESYIVPPKDYSMSPSTSRRYRAVI